MHTYAYLYIYIHTFTYPRVVTYGDRYRVPLICHRLKRLLRLLFSRFLSFISPYLFPSPLLFLRNFTHSILHRERIYLSRIFDSSLALLLSPSFAAVTILLPDTRGIIRTGSSLLA